MSDDIDIGISVTTQPSDIANAERAAAAVKEFTLTAQQGAAILASVGNDYEKFVDEVRKLKDAHDQAAASAATAATAAQQVASAAQQTTQATTAAAAATSASAQATTQATQATQANTAAQTAATQATQQTTTATQQSAVAQGTAAQATTQASSAVAASAGKLQLFARAADASFTVIPRGARTAANALQTLSIGIETGSGSMSGMVRSAGSLAFGLSQLSQNANIVAGAAGFGAIVTVVGLIVELLKKGTEATREQEAAFKELGTSAEGLDEMSKAVGRLTSALAGLPGIQTKDFPLVAQTPAAKKALDELTAATKSLTTHDAVEQLTTLGGEVAQLKEKLADGRLSTRQYTDAITELGRRASSSGETFPGLEKLLANATEAGAKFDAATLRLRRANADAASNREDTRVFGATPELAKRLDEVNSRMLALGLSGAIGARGVEDNQKALDLALKSWDTFTKSEQGATFAGVRFRDVMDAQSESAKRAAPAAVAAAQSILAAAKSVVAGERIIAGGPALAESAQKDAEKAEQLTIARTQGEAAARRRAADDARADAIRELALESGLATDKKKKLAAIETAHREEILKINTDEANKLTALTTHLADERLAAEAKLSDDEFGVRRAAADKQHAADLKQITDLKLASDQDLAARLQAADAYSLSIQAIEKDRSDKIEEIRIAAQQHIDDVTGKTGDADPEKIRQRYKKQLDVLAATIASASTTDAEKAAARVGTQLIEQAIPLDVAKARMSELSKTLSGVTSTGDSQITRTSALLAAHAITEREAREQIVDALTKERDAIAAALPLLERQAALLPGNPEAQALVEQYRTKLLELNIAVDETSDSFFKLKETGRDAATSALATFLQDAIKLGGQSRVEINALGVDLHSAQDELHDLLAIPEDQRSGTTNTRISQLRNEIASTTVQLDNAKQSITTWRDLFVSALSSIADALVRVSSQMLATALIERLLGLAVFGIADPTDAILASPIPGVSAIGFAGGGLIRGPGSSTSDSIPAWLSDQEYVIRAARVQQFGKEFFDRINFDGEAPPIVLPSRIRRYAAGGLVESAGASRFSEPQRASTRDELHVFVHSTDEHILRVNKGPENRDITIKHVRENGGALGRR